VLRGHVAAPELPRVGRREPKPRGYVAAPELPRAGRRESKPRGYVAAPELSQSGGGSRCLDLIIRGVPDPQSADNDLDFFFFIDFLRRAAT
jgi:hypothetical protein